MKPIETLKQKVKLLKSESYTLAFASKDDRTPWYAKLMIVITLGYFFSPVDLIPDFVPVLGYLDDLIILPLLIIISIKLIPKEILTECREKARQHIQNQRKSAWWLAIPVILFWLTIVLLVLWRILWN
ncbi:MAG TPA: DUF1232 domain-containing protein [Bacteroidales bacterium]